MKNVAILTMDSLDDFYAYDSMLDEPFNKAGWQTHYISWRDEAVNWDKFDVVVVRSTWDYQQDQQAFVDCLKRIEDSSAVLENPLTLMLWNIDKHYLKQLHESDIRIVPTQWHNSYSETMLSDAFDFFETDSLVIKPTISANADDTFKISLADKADYEAILARTFANKALMLQPFVPAIIEPGEYSLFYFGDQFSHAILKTPKANDFRVQEEHGGRLSSITPTPDMLNIAQKTLSALPCAPLYARIDLIEHHDQHVLMEVEVIEPSLYFNMDDTSAQRFVDVFCEKYS